MMNPDAPHSQLAHRLAERARLMNSVGHDGMPSLQQIFTQAKMMGALLHTARQCLEIPLTSLADIVPDEQTLWFWEHGLMLPQEITDGKVTALVRWYIDQVRQQRQHEMARHLSHDMLALYTELQPQDPEE